MKRLALVTAATLAATWITAPQITSATAASPAPSIQRQVAAAPLVAAETRLAIRGAVDDRRTYTPTELAAFPQHTVSVTFTSGGVPEDHTFSGALLVDVLLASAPRFDPAVKNDSLTFAVRATATDGYRALVSWGEIDPGFGNNEVLLATTQDGVALERPRLVVPGDVKGGRYVTDVKALWVKDLGG